MFSSLKLLQCSITFLWIKQDKERGFSLKLTALQLWDRNIAWSLWKYTLFAAGRLFWYASSNVCIKRSIFHKATQSLLFIPSGFQVILVYIHIRETIHFSPSYPNHQITLNHTRKHMHTNVCFHSAVICPCFSCSSHYCSWTVASPYIICLTHGILLQGSVTSSS